MALFLTVLHVMVCVFLIVVVLLQRGKGAEIGAVFGSGSGTTIFGSRGAGNFLTRLTTGAAIVFMLTSLTLAYFAQEGARSTLFDEQATQQKPQAPASPFAEPKPEAPPAAAEGGGGFQEVPAPAPEKGAAAHEAGKAPAAQKPAQAPAAPPSSR